MQIGLNAAENGLRRPVRPPSLRQPDLPGPDRGRDERHQNGASSRHFKDEAGAPRADALPRVENEKREHEPDASRANYPRKSGGNATIRPKLPQNCHKTRRSPKKHRKEPTWLSARASASPRAPGRRVA